MVLNAKVCPATAPSRWKGARILSLLDFSFISATLWVPPCHRTFKHGDVCGGHVYGGMVNLLSRLEWIPGRIVMS